MNAQTCIPDRTQELTQFTLNTEILMFLGKDFENSGGELNRFDDSGEVVIMVICLCYGQEEKRENKT